MDNGTKPAVLTPAQQTEYEQHLQLLQNINLNARSTQEEEARAAPLFAGAVMTKIPQYYSQYGLLGRILPDVASKVADSSDDNTPTSFADSRIMLNIGAPWSAFICGQQGSGKSHTLSCILENCLIQSSAGILPKPLSGIIFHWDRFTGYSSHQICEAAYLASSGIPVRVLVSPSNYHVMKDAYENLQGFSNVANKPKVLPLLFRDEQLNSKRILTMMGVKTDGEPLPLYLEVILRILRELAFDNNGRAGFDYGEFRNRLALEDFTGAQNGPMKLRLELLESFLRTTSTSKITPLRAFVPQQKARPGDRNPRGSTIEIKPLKKLSSDQEKELKDAWTFKPGTLTIVDLSCPFVDENAACALFTICLELFLEDRNSAGRVVALDEAHKFLTGSSGATAFTEELLQVIRQQRHLGTRVVIATQEPTISPKLLELCNFTLVHRFQSPEWFRTLQAYLAGASAPSDEEATGVEHNTVKSRSATLFKQIVHLQCGQALLFAPSAVIDLTTVPGTSEFDPVKLGIKYLRVSTRQRITIDGGRSIMAE